MQNFGCRADEIYMSRHPFSFLCVSLHSTACLQFTEVFYSAVSSLIYKEHLLILLGKKTICFASIPNRTSSEVLRKHWLSFYDTDQSNSQGFFFFLSLRLFITLSAFKNIQKKTPQTQKPWRYRLIYKIMKNINVTKNITLTKLKHKQKSERKYL